MAISTANVQIAGAQVLREGDLIRIRISADQLFSPGTAQMISSGSHVLDQVATTLGSQFSRQRVGIEGHTDTGQLYGGAFSTPYQLAGAQAQAVMDQLSRRNNLPTQQLFIIAHGPKSSDWRQPNCCWSGRQSSYRDCRLSRDFLSRYQPRQWLEIGLRIH